LRKFKGFKIVEEFLPERINDHPEDWYVGDFLHEIFRKDLWILKNYKRQFRAEGVPFIVTAQGDRSRKKWKLWKALVKTNRMNGHQKYQKYEKGRVK